MIYVITAVHNRYKITEAFVEQLLMQSYKDIRLILVDDGCVDGTSDMVKEKMPNAIIIYGNGNLWWGGALHEAYKWIKKMLKKMLTLCLQTMIQNLNQTILKTQLMFCAKNNVHY